MTLKAFLIAAGVYGGVWGGDPQARSWQQTLLGAGAAGPAPAEAPGAGRDRQDGAVLASPTAPVLPVKAFLTRGCRAPFPGGLLSGLRALRQQVTQEQHPGEISAARTRHLHPSKRSRPGWWGFELPGVPARGRGLDWMIF